MSVILTVAGVFLLLWVAIALLVLMSAAVSSIERRHWPTTGALCTAVYCIGWAGARLFFVVF